MTLLQTLNQYLQEKGYTTGIEHVSQTILIGPLHSLKLNPEQTHATITITNLYGNSQLYRTLQGIPTIPITLELANPNFLDNLEKALQK